MFALTYDLPHTKTWQPTYIANGQNRLDYCISRERLPRNWVFGMNHASPMNAVPYSKLCHHTSSSLLFRIQGKVGRAT